jgi:hypothetical protein
MRKVDTPSLGGWCVEAKTVPFVNILSHKNLQTARFQMQPMRFHLEPGHSRQFL